MRQVLSSIILASVISLAMGISIQQSPNEKWQVFKDTYGKIYSESENRFRMQVFLDNIRLIEQHNARHAKGEVSYTLAMNKYGDMLPHEFASIMTGYKSERNHKDRKASTFVKPLNVEIPDSIDWFAKGAVTPVNNQGPCGSCWAFSVTGAVEGQHFIKTGELVALSAQNLIDCDYTDYGCSGGWFDSGFEYIKKNGGIDSASSYPYEAQDGSCRFNASNVAATVTGYVDIKPGDEEDLKAAVATAGPVAVAMDAGNRDFQFYSTGIYIDPRCRKDNLNHSALVVGYGTEDGVDYWLVKNAWGTSWGDAGYIKMARNLDNQCGIATKASYSLV